MAGPMHIHVVSEYCGRGREVCVSPLSFIGFVFFFLFPQPIDFAVIAFITCDKIVSRVIIINIIF